MWYNTGRRMPPNTDKGAMAMLKGVPTILCPELLKNAGRNGAQRHTGAWRRQLPRLRHRPRRRREAHPCGRHRRGGDVRGHFAGDAAGRIRGHARGADRKGGAGQGPAHAHLGHVRQHRIPARPARGQGHRPHPPLRFLRAGQDRLLRGADHRERPLRLRHDPQGRHPAPDPSLQSPLHAGFSYIQFSGFGFAAHQFGYHFARGKRPDRRCRVRPR